MSDGLYMSRRNYGGDEYHACFPAAGASFGIEGRVHARWTPDYEDEKDCPVLIWRQAAFWRGYLACIRGRETGYIGCTVQSVECQAVPDRKRNHKHQPLPY